MTKADIVNEVAKATGLEKQNVQRVIEAFMNTVKESVSKDNSVYLRGFGSFTAKKRAQKTARDMKLEKTIIVPAHCIPAFKPSKVFVNLVKFNVTK